MQIEMEKKDLLNHQKKIVESAPDKYGIFLRPRVGKTATAIRLATTRAHNALVIVPKSLKEQWEEAIADWNNKSDGSPSDTEFYVITKETFRRDWKKLPAYECVIVDEVHIGFANFKSQLFKSATDYIARHQSRFVYLLTGTPFTSSSWSVYSLGKLLGKDWKWFSWKSRYFIDIKMGPRSIPVQKDKANPGKYKEWMQEEMRQIISNIGITMELSDISEQAEDENINEYFDLNAEQKQTIKEVFDPLPIINFTRVHQIESGTLKGDGYSVDRTIPCDKTKRLEEIVASTPKIAVVCRYNLQLHLYQKIFEQAGRKVFVINGETENKNEIVKEVDKLEECVVLINSMCSAGYSLKSIDTMVFASMDYSFVNYAQIHDRLKDLSKHRPCTYIHLLTRSDKKHKSVDQAVYDAVMNKQDFDCAIFKSN